ncbi:MAG: WecB/TagA/CpsF family glycosyltransferase [Dyadobacter fermentans]
MATIPKSILEIIDSITLLNEPDDFGKLLGKLSNNGFQSHQIISFVNAHALNLAHRNEDFAAALISSDVIFRDGIGMKMLYKSMGIAPGLNMNGTDAIPQILERFKGERVALMGTEEPYLSNAATKLAKAGHHIVGTINGFADMDAYLKFVSETQPSVVVLGMGMPRQELLAAKLTQVCPGGCLWINGGAIIDFLGGKVQRAPGWMQKNGLEWLFRLASEPRRLFNRYVIGNAVFISRIPDTMKQFEKRGYHKKRGNFADGTT